MSYIIKLRRKNMSNNGQHTGRDYVLKDLHDLPKAANKVKFAKKAFTRAADEVKDKMNDTLQKSAKVITEKASDFRENAINYVKENPAKAIVIGITAISGLLAAFLFRNKN
jgi:ElaB/YqjD/DUF883 family membrane-anchored ribosome-binding protein